MNQNDFFCVVSSLPSRIIYLIWKVISFQGLVFITATWLVFTGKVDGYVWLLTGIVLIFGRYALDFVREIQR